MKSWVLGKEYKFADSTCEDLFNDDHHQNPEMVRAIKSHGGSFKVIDIYRPDGQVTQVMFADGLKSNPYEAFDMQALPIEMCLLESDREFFVEVNSEEDVKECAEEATQVKKSFTLCVDLPIPETKEEAIAHINRIKAIFGIEA
ncbi:hypothetical protein [Yersinia phage MHG19]|nr:hypothetical protein [Yersinia phage MHG19]